MTYNEAKQKVAEEFKFNLFSDLQKAYPNAAYRYYELAAKHYAEQVARDALRRATERAERTIGAFEWDTVIESSITDTEIILP